MKNYLTIFILFSVIGCKPDAQEMISYAFNPENGLVVSQEIDDYHFELKYVPSEIIIEREKQNGVLSSKEEGSRKEELDDIEQYELYVVSKRSRVDGNLIGISMNQGNLIQPQFFHVENIGATDRCRILFSFNKEAIQQDLPRKIEVNLAQNDPLNLEVLSESINGFKKYYSN